MDIKIGLGNFVNKNGDTINGDLIFGNGSNAIPEVSGIGNIGSQTHPFNTIYANNLVALSSSGTDNGPFVHLSGDTMTGQLIVPQLTVGSRNGTVGTNSLAAGLNTTASQFASAAFGSNSVASGFASLAEGQGTSSGAFSHAEGQSTASDSYTHAEGNSTQAKSFAAHSEGFTTTAHSPFSHSEGNLTHAYSNASHSEGTSTAAGAGNTHSEGSSTIAGSEASHAEGINTYAEGVSSHTENSGTFASSDYSHAEGINTLAGQTVYPYTLTSGTSTIAISPGDITGPLTGATQLRFFFFSNLLNGGDYAGTISHINSATFDGTNTLVDFGPGQLGGSTSGLFSRIESVAAHAEGIFTNAFGRASHSQGINTIASGTASFVGGSGSIAGGDYSLAIGVGAKTSTLPGTSILTDSQNVSTTNNIQDSVWFRFAGGVNLVSGTDILNRISGINNLGSILFPFNNIYGKNVYNDGDLVITSGTNLGTGSSVFASKSGSNLQFKSILAGTNINVSNTSNDITISQIGNSITTPASTTNNSVSMWSGTTGGGFLDSSVIISNNGLTLNAETISGTTISGNNAILNGSVTINTTTSDLGLTILGTGSPIMEIGNDSTHLVGLQWFQNAGYFNTFGNSYPLNFNASTLTFSPSTGNNNFTGNINVSSSVNASVISGTTISGNTAVIRTLTNTTLNGSTANFTTIVNSPVISGTTISGNTINVNTQINLASGASILNTVSGVNTLGNQSNPFSGTFTKQINTYNVVAGKYNEVPVGLINSLNTTYTLSFSPYDLSLQLYKNGLAMAPSGIGAATIDYMLSGSTITMVSPPFSGATLLCHYNYLT